MQRKRRLLITVLLLALLVLVGCVPSIGEPASPSTLAPATIVIETVAPATVTLTPPETPALATTTPAPATATLAPTATSAPVEDPAEDPAPVNQDPVAITHDFTNVRRGPGLAYDVSHVLGPNTTAPVLGRNDGGDWWAVPGPGDGPGPVGWVSASVVVAQGNLGGVPVLPAPPLDPDLPIVGNSGPPPGGDTCVVVHPGPGDTGPTFLRQSPDLNSEAVAILGLDKWADIVEAQSGWYRVRDASGAGGWVHQSTVSFAGRCTGPGSGPDLPTVDDPGSPPSNVCVVVRPGQFPPPGIHLGPGRQFALVARLGNWAEVVKSEVDWHQILLGPGEVGWISDDDVDLMGPCATP